MPIYPQHIVEDYNQSPEASHEREQFELQLQNAMIAVPVIMICVYAHIGFTQLSNKNPGNTGTMIQDIISTEMHNLPSSCTRPVVTIVCLTLPPLHLCIASVPSPSYLRCCVCFPCHICCRSVIVALIRYLLPVLLL